MELDVTSERHVAVRDVFAVLPGVEQRSACSYAQPATLGSDARQPRHRFICVLPCAFLPSSVYPTYL